VGWAKLNPDTVDSFMMRIFSVDTAEQSCSLALVEDGIPVCEEFFSTRVTHSRILMDMIEHMLHKRVETTLADIDAFVAARGPGSFTGVRIGIRFVKVWPMQFQNRWPASPAWMGLPGRCPIHHCRSVQ